MSIPTRCSRLNHALTAGRDRAVAAGESRKFFRWNVKTGIGHSKWLKERSLQVFVQALPTHLLDNVAKHIGRNAVLTSTARLK